MSLEYCTPLDIPKEVSQYDGNIPQLNVGKSGKIGLLQLELQHDSEKKKTVITHKKTQVPLYLQKALHYDMDYPSMAHLFILSPSGGILQGDRYRMDVELKNNAISHLTTQGATRIYKMDSNYATHMVTINLKNNSYLEFIPEQIIPYIDSRFYQKTELNIDDSSTVVYSETIVPGRIAMGEMFDFDVCYLKTEGSIDKKIQFRDSSLLIPKEQKTNSITMFDDKTILTSVYLMTKKPIEKINEMINEMFSQLDEISGSSSMMPNNSGLSVRILGNSSEDQKTTIYEILKIIRKEILTGYVLDYSIIFSVSDAVIIPKIFESFLTRIHFEYLISGASVLAGVSISTTGGADSIISSILVFFDNPSLICEIIPESEIIPTMLFSLKIGI